MPSAYPDKRNNVWCSYYQIELNKHICIIIIVKRIAKKHQQINRTYVTDLRTNIVQTLQLMKLMTHAVLFDRCARFGLFIY